MHAQLYAFMCQVLVTDFGVVYMHRCLHPGAMMRFMPKVIINIPNLQPHSIMYMEVIHMHMHGVLYMHVHGGTCAIYACT